MSTIHLHQANTLIPALHRAPGLRARLISNALFEAGGAAVVFVLPGGTTWLSGGFWAPDGVYSRFVPPAIGLVWGLFVSGVLLIRSPFARAGA